MSRKPKYQQDIDDFTSNLGCIAAFVFLLVKLTYFVALPIYKIMTLLLADKVKQAEQKQFEFWMRFVPVLWLVDLNKNEVTPNIKKSSVTSAAFPIVLPLFLISVPLTNAAPTGSFIALISFILACFSIGCAIGFYRNFKLTKFIQNQHNNLY